MPRKTKEALKSVEIKEIKEKKSINTKLHNGKTKVADSSKKSAAKVSKKSEKELNKSKVLTANVKSTKSEPKISKKEVTKSTVKSKEKATSKTPAKTVKKAATKSAAKSEVKATSKTPAKAVKKAATKSAAKSEVKATSKPAAKTVKKAATKSAAKSEVKATSKTAAKAVKKAATKSAAKSEKKATSKTPTKAVKKTATKSAAKSEVKATSKTPAKAVKKVATKPAVKSKEKATSKPAAKTVKKAPLPIPEYYDLPYHYDQTVVKVLAQTPKTLFVYWDVSEEDKNKYLQKYGNDFFNNTVPFLRVIDKNSGFYFDVDVDDFANGWYLHVDNSKCDYSIELYRKQRPYTDKVVEDQVYITSSNTIETPNDHILFDINRTTIYYRNAKTGEITSRDISKLGLLKNIGKIYNIYDLYKNIYKDENVEELFDLNNPSSNNPTSTFK